jgi:chromate reductase
VSDLKVLGICGSLRRKSLNMAALRATNELLPPGMSLQITSIADLPMFNQDVLDAGLPEPVNRLRAEIAQADGLLIACPEYNFSMTAPLKNAIDWASRPRSEAALRGKTVAIAGASTGQYGALWAIQDLRRVLGIAGARVIEGEVSVPRAHELVDETGTLSSGALESRLRDLLSALAAEAAPMTLAA